MPTCLADEQKTSQLPPNDRPVATGLCHHGDVEGVPMIFGMPRRVGTALLRDVNR